MRAGVFQCAGGGLTPDERLSRLSRAIKREALDVVVCSELFMSGYNVGALLRTRAEPCGGAFADKIEQLARTTGTAIVYGYPESDGKRLYNSAVCITPDTGVICNRRKLLLPPGFEGEYFAPSDAGLTCFDLHGLRCAIVICYEVEFPEVIRSIVESGAQVVLVPTALGAQWRNVAHQLIPTRAFENGVWLLYANHAGEENGLRYLGNSCIVAPNGSVAARAGAGEELISATLALDEVDHAQARLPYLRDLKSLRKLL